jgi:hypothetical protein
VVNDPEGFQIPLYDTKVQLMFHFDRHPSKPDAIVAYPHWRIPVQPDMQCMPHTMLILNDPSLLTTNQRNAAIAKANDTADVKATRKAVKQFLTNACSDKTPEGKARLQKLKKIFSK